MSHFIVSVIHKKNQDIDDLLAPYMENCCGTPDYKYMEFYEDSDCEIDEATGKRGYWQNPNAKWDWYQIGGRWAGYFEHDGELYDEIPIDWYPSGVDQDMYNKALGDWKKWESGTAPMEDLPFELGFYKPKYIYDRYKNAETYAKYQATPWERAVVTPDGVWHEVGSMGWWGISNENGEDMSDWIDNFQSLFIDPYRGQDFIVTAVDCHI